MNNINKLWRQSDILLFLVLLQVLHSCADTVQLSNINVCNLYLKLIRSPIWTPTFSHPYTRPKEFGNVIFFLNFFSFKLNSFLFLALCVYRSIPPALLMSADLLTRDHFWEKALLALGFLASSKANLTQFLEFYGLTAAFLHAAFVSPQAHVSVSRLPLLERWLPSSDPWTSLFPIVALQYVLQLQSLSL